MSTASASATDVGRVRPTEKYWTDYEDWKVRPSTRSRRFDASVRPERMTNQPPASGRGGRPESSAREGFVEKPFFPPDPSRRTDDAARIVRRSPIGNAFSPHAQTTHHPSAVEHFESFERMARGKLLTVFLDYDGTVSEIVNQPERAFMTSEMRDAVRRVASLYPTAIISGRSRDKVYDFVKLPELYYAGSHGLDIVAPAKIGNDERDDGRSGSGGVSPGNQREMHQPAPWAPAVMDDVFRRASLAVATIPGATVDHNKFCVSLHYRNCENRQDWTRVKEVVDAIVATDPDRLKRCEGRKVFEVKPRVAWDKGKALSYLLGQLGLDRDPKNAEPGSVLSLYFGDDHTDEDAFDELKHFPHGAGCGVIVSSVPKPSSAAFSVKNPSEVLTFLNSIADLAERGVTRRLDTAATIGAE